jgi:hypothetical protein
VTKALELPRTSRGIRARARKIAFGASALLTQGNPMGQKYLPTDKDVKNGRRFIQKNHGQSKFFKTAGTPPTRKPKKK